MLRFWFYPLSLLAITTIALLGRYYPAAYWLFLILIPFIALGLYDIFQTRHNILRNYPIWGHWRYILFSIRPMIQQYFINTDQSGRPFNKEMRDLVYQRATQTIDTMPFGTQRDVHEVSYEWVTHSMMPTKPSFNHTRVLIGGPQCSKPYSSSRLNVSAMSFGAISPEAIRALNRGAKLGNFAQSTGEGGLSKHHLKEGGDLIWQIGTGYFSCRSKDGRFDPELFEKNARHENVKMIEIKISQGAKPSHGAILPADKVTPEIAEARGIEVGKDCLSPAAHSTFSTPVELLQFVKQLRELSGGKPIGFKLCIGIPQQFMAICKAMINSAIYPDFIVIDGSEGGTGAAPVEFSDFIGMPLNDGLIFAHNCLVGSNLRQHIRLVASGKVISGFDIITKIALGADICNSARAMMFSLGCVQSRRCNTNTCPTGVATQDPKRRYALNINEKAPRVTHYQGATLKSFLDILGAVGLEHPEKLHPSHIHRRISNEEALTYDQIFDYLTPGSLLNNTAPDSYLKLWEEADPNSFDSHSSETHRAESH